MLRNSKERKRFQAQDPIYIELKIFFKRPSKRAFWIFHPSAIVQYIKIPLNRYSMWERVEKMLKVLRTNVEKIISAPKIPQFDIDTSTNISHIRKLKALCLCYYIPCDSPLAYSTLVALMIFDIFIKEKFSLT